MINGLIATNSRIVGNPEVRELHFDSVYELCARFPMILRFLRAPIWLAADQPSSFHSTDDYLLSCTGMADVCASREEDISIPSKVGQIIARGDRR
jgi:hypothetical protein